MVVLIVAFLGLLSFIFFKLLPNICRPIIKMAIVAGLVVAYYFILFLLRILLHPLSAFKRKPRFFPPKCLLDPSLGTHEYVIANGLKFHCVTAGDKSNPLMLFVHGFPEFWFSWRHQLREFSKDYRVVAIDMRGYGETERPPNKSDYVVKNLVQDISELVAAFGYNSCVLVGHDWGGGVAWNVAVKCPHLVDKLVIMNSPNPKIASDHIRKSFTQLAKSSYMLALQFPRLPELTFRLCDYQLLEDMFLGKQVGVVNKASMPPEVIEAYKYTFSQPGALTGPINYYRCIHMENWAGINTVRDDMPILIIWGDKDSALDIKMADQHTSISSNTTVRHIPNASHWVQQESPELCNQYMREFLDSHSH